MGNLSYMFGEKIELQSPPNGELGQPAERDPASTPTPPPVSAPEGAPPIPGPVGGAPPPGSKKVGSGVYMQLLLQLRRWTDDQLLAAVHAYYPGSRAGINDLKYNCSMIARRIPVKPSTLRVKTEEREMLPPPPWDPLWSGLYGEVVTGVHIEALTTALDEQERCAASPNGSHPPSPVIRVEVLDQGGAKQPTVAVVDSDKQPSRFRKSVDPDREFDKTSLRERGHLQWCHRDSLAHLTRWAFAGRFIDGTKEVLDVGCGPDVQLINILTMPRNNVPKRYVGVDLNNQPQKHPTRQWATIHWQFNFIERFSELGQFDVVTNFEVLEHMSRSNGLKFLAGLKACIKPDGLLLLSTPCYNQHAASVHLHEWRIDELAEAIASVGLRVEHRFGTFASAPDIKRVAIEEDLRLIERLKQYYSGEYLAIVLAPLYPDASRNNLWCLRHA